jgi:hypothetical protein
MHLFILNNSILILIIVEKLNVKIITPTILDRSPP